MNKNSKIIKLLNYIKLLFKESNEMFEEYFPLNNEVNFKTKNKKNMKKSR